MRILDAVITDLPHRKGMQPWYETLPSQVRKEVDDIKAGWQEGRIKASKTGLSKSLSKALKARGIDIGHKGVLAWLERQS